MIDKKFAAGCNRDIIRQGAELVGLDLPAAIAVWETCTPYFDRRNIHFYVNVCGFHIVEFFNERHPAPDEAEDFIGDGSEGMFEFRKEIGR